MTNSALVPMHMTLTKPFLLTVTREEIVRILAAFGEGATLRYEEGEKRLTLTQDGTLYFEGFVIAPRIFAVVDEDGYLARYEKDTAPLKALVKRAVFSEGTERLCEVFDGFPALEEVSLPDSVISICHTFKDCNKLKPYPLPPRLDTLRGEVFGRRAPSRVVLPDTVTDIEAAFKGTSVRSVTVPGKVAYVPRRCFYRAARLKEVILREGVAGIDPEAFSGCTALTRVVLPSTLKYIADFAFSGCSSLSEIDLPPETEVGERAFDGTPLQAVLRRRILLQRPVEPCAPPADAPMDEWRAVLGGLPLEEQIRHVSVGGAVREESFSYGSADSLRVSERATPLWLLDGVEALLISDGILVGVRLARCSAFIGQTVCLYSATEEDGVGSRTVEDMLTLSLCREPHE